MPGASDRAQVAGWEQIPGQNQVQMVGCKWQARRKFPAKAGANPQPRPGVNGRVKMAGRVQIPGQSQVQWQVQVAGQVQMARVRWPGTSGRVQMEVLGAESRRKWLMQRPGTGGMVRMASAKARCQWHYGKVQ